MEWLQSLLGGENGSAVQLVLITVGLVILLVAVFWLFRKITGAAAPKAGRNRVPRLSVTDSTRVDENRYLVLVRRDNIEHLVMIGGPSDIVIETNISRLGATAKPAANTSIQPEKQNPKSDGLPASTEEPKQPQAEPAKTGAVPTPAAATAAVAAGGVVAADNATATQPVEEPAQPAAPTTAETPAVETDREAPLPEISKTIDVEMKPEPSATIGKASIDDDGTENLEAAISEQLDDALAGEEISLDDIDIDVDLSIDEEAVASQEENSDSADEVDSGVEPAEKRDDVDKDDMQRLLDELAGIKQPAQ